MVLLKVIVMLVCGLVAFQDFKERAVSWILFPIIGSLLAFLYLNATSFEQYYLFVLTNTLLISGILLILFLYTKHIARKGFLNVSFGLGDLLFFYAFALGFPTLTFIVLFATSILFSLVVFLFSKTEKEKETIPLAGLMGFFLIGVFLLSFFPNVPSLYIL
jgi:predicted membrane channel-forming protein YqfA (hemolysin III family)